MDANQFAKSGKHLPLCIRDFHDAKDVFKCIGGMRDLHVRDRVLVSWVDGQCYVIDKFLHFMAQHGYTLQRCRRPIDFYDLDETIEKRREGEVDILKEFLGQK